MTYAEWAGWKEKTNHIANAADFATIKEKLGKGGEGVQTIGRIDRDKYSVVSSTIRTDEVIISDERIKHIMDHHPNDYERYAHYIGEMLENPQYILDDPVQNTAVILHEFIEFSGAHPGRGSAGRERITRALIDPNVFSAGTEQLSLFAPPAVDRLVAQGVPPRAAQRMVREEAVQCLARAL